MLCSASVSCAAAKSSRKPCGRGVPAPSSGVGAHAVMVSWLIFASMESSSCRAPRSLAASGCGNEGSRSGQDRSGQAVEQDRRDRQDRTGQGRQQWGDVLSVTCCDACVRCELWGLQEHRHGRLLTGVLLSRRVMCVDTGMNGGRGNSLQICSPGHLDVKDAGCDKVTQTQEAR